MSERVDAGGGRVPEGWHGPVTEHGHDRSGKRPHPGQHQPYITPGYDTAPNTAATASSSAFLDRFRVKAEDHLHAGGSERRIATAERRVTAGSGPDGERRTGPAERRAVPVERRIGLPNRRSVEGVAPNGGSERRTGPVERRIAPVGP